MGFDAFISYSREADGMLAPRLKRGLHRFAKPWHRMRALRVFLDDAALSANPDLWGSIVDALDASEWFVLLASPEAAASEWVNKEVEHWCASKSLARLIIVLTGGAIDWDDEVQRASETSTALPQTLRGRLLSEPRFVDLRWARAEVDTSLSNARFREAVADIAAPMHGVSKDQLLGDDVRQHRRTRLYVAATIASLLVLLAIAVTGALIARDQADEAQQQARIAGSRQLAGEAIATSDADLDLGQLLAAEAHAREPNAQSRAALLQTITRSPRSVGLIPGSGKATRVAFSPSDAMLAIGKADGVLILWDAESMSRGRSPDASDGAAVTALAFSDDGGRLLAGRENGSVDIWDTASGALLARGSIGSTVESVALSQGGDRVVAADQDGRASIWPIDRPDGVATWETAPFPSRVRLAGSELRAGGPGGNVTSVDLTSGEVDSAWLGGGMPLVAAYDREIRAFAGWVLGQDVYVDLGSGEDLRFFDIGRTNIERLALTDDLRYLAAAGEGRATLWDTRTRQQIGPPLPGTPSDPTSIDLSADGRFLAASGERGVRLWDRDANQLVRTIRPPGSRDFADLPNVLRGAVGLAFSPDGTRAAWNIVEGGQGGTGRLRVVIWDLEARREIRRLDAELLGSFVEDGSALIVSSFPHGPDADVRMIDVLTGTETAVANSRYQPPPPPPDPEAPWSVENGLGYGASVAANGGVTIWDTSTRQRLGSVTAPGATFTSVMAFSPSGESLGVATAGGTVSFIEVGGEAWRERACELAGRRLTPSEEERYIAVDSAVDACPANG